MIIPAFFDFSQTFFSLFIASSCHFFHATPTISGSLSRTFFPHFVRKSSMPQLFSVSLALLLLVASCAAALDLSGLESLTSKGNLQEKDVLDLIPDPENPRVSSFVHCSVCSVLANELQSYITKLHTNGVTEVDDVQDAVEILCEELKPLHGLRMMKEVDAKSGKVVEGGKKEIWPEYGSSHDVVDVPGEEIIKGGWSEDAFEAHCGEAVASLDSSKLKRITSHALKKTMEKENDVPVEKSEKSRRSFARGILCGRCKLFSEEQSVSSEGDEL